MDSERSVRWRGLGAIDLIALILLLFVIWLAAVHEFPLYDSRSQVPNPQPTPAAH